MKIPQTYMSPPSEFAQDQYAYDIWNSLGNDSDPAHRHLINAFRVAIRDELTERQRTYLMAYYYERLTMEEIAERFAVNKSSVSRTINRAKKQLEAVLRYASPALLEKGYSMGKRTSNTKKKRRSSEWRLETDRY